MRHAIPSIKSVMTSFPYWVAHNASIEDALRIMNEKGIHHLPVKHNGELAGVVTRKDLEKRLQFHLEANISKQILVDDVYVKNPYVVDIDELLDNVLLHMSQHHLGSALVTKNGRLAGLFTTNDACRTFGEYLREHFRPSGGNDVA